MQEFVHLGEQPEEARGETASGADGVAAQLVGLYDVWMFWSQEEGGGVYNPNDQTKLNSIPITDVCVQQE